MQEIGLFSRSNVEVRDGTREEMLRGHDTIVPTASEVKEEKIKGIWKKVVSATSERNMKYGVPCKSDPSKGRPPKIGCNEMIQMKCTL